MGGPANLQGGRRLPQGQSGFLLGRREWEMLTGKKEPIILGTEKKGEGKLSFGKSKPQKEVEGGTGEGKKKLRFSFINSLKVSRGKRYVGERAKENRAI